MAASNYEIMEWWKKINFTNKDNLLVELYNFIGQPRELDSSPTINIIRHLKQNCAFTSVTNEWYYKPNRYPFKTIE